MSFWQQLLQLLSEAPGNAVYHLVTLFAIQATLALAISQWRRERAQEQEDPFTRRLALAAAAMLLARFILLLISLLLAARGDRVLAVDVLPPLEQAVNTVTALLLVWAVVSPPSTFPRLLDVIAVLLLFLTGVMYAFFAQEWATSAAAGLTYNGTPQSTAWGILQLSVLGAGTVYLLFARRPGWFLSVAPIVVLLVAHVAHFWDYPEIIPRDTEIAIWIRLGHLVALPLLAIIAYRNTLSRLLSGRRESGPPAEQFAETLRLATHVIDSPDLRSTLAAATELVAELSGAPFVGLAVTESERPDRLQVSTFLQELTLEQRVRSEPQSWALNLDDWPAFRLAMDQEQPLELLPEGVGARQLHDLAQELGIETPGPLMIVPLQAKAVTLGVLLLGAPAEQEKLAPPLRTLAFRLANYVAQVLYNNRAAETHLQEAQPINSGPTEMVSGRVIALEEERDRAKDQAETLAGRLQQTEMRLNQAQQQARDLAATVEALEQARPGDDRAALEAEIEALRESLFEAEEAMAMAAAGEGELSPEWVTMTISRYSADLEAAQAQIAELEETLAQREPSQMGELLTALAQELRTPLTSIGGYTDLLLGETMGILGSKQRQFLQRVKANVERLGVLLEQIVRLAAADNQPARLTDVEPVAVAEVVETAVDTVITHMRKKELRLNLAIPEAIPRLYGNREALCQVFIHLLHNAFQVSEHHGEVVVTAHTDTMQAETADGGQETEHFIHLAVQDSGGGIRPEDRAHVFDPQYRADHPLITGLGDTGAGLSVAQTLVGAHGGRIWVDSEMGVGTTFSVLLPVGQNGSRPPQDAEAPAPGGTTESGH